ncbi:MAG: ImmA/IrrE family metallo-endopeptidase [Clostridium sp.]|nr:ImmA/IrrE family metallo-endopeptidase [Clostridium sp.]
MAEEDIDDIKELVKEKRVNYALAPIGTQIFEWIAEQNPNIHFELVDFASEKIDGMLYIPVTGSERAYIILNSNKPLINQIFTTAHEYYHYIKDYASVREQPYICNFGELENVNEKKASRFAAEFLLPEEALRNELKLQRKRMQGIGPEKWSFAEYAVIAILITIKYQMPLKAVIYRLYEEGYINNVEMYIKNYDFIKSLLQELKYFYEKVDRLYSNENKYLNEKGVLYRQMKAAYITGYAARNEILEDARELGLDEEMVLEFFDDIEEDSTEDDAEMLEYLNHIWEDKR